MNENDFSQGGVFVGEVPKPKLRFTSGRWRVSSRDLGPCGREYLIENDQQEVVTGGGFVMTAADAQRIVDCVNALEGIDDPNLFMHLAYTMQVRYAPEMLRALKTAHSNCARAAACDRGESPCDLSQLIRKVEGV